MKRKKTKKLYIIIGTSMFISALVFILLKIKSSAVNSPIIPVVAVSKGVDPYPLKNKNSVADSSTIPGIILWKGIDPYPRIDWLEAKPELRSAVDAFQKAWGSNFTVLQVYRPKEYTEHIRSVWEVWRYVHGKSYTSGYGCENYTHIQPRELKSFSSSQQDSLEKEARLHDFTNGGDTPPACKSDHSLGIAVDINPPSLNSKIYQKWMEVGASVGLCHYIQGDEPHFGLISYLPAGTNCVVQ